MNILWSGHGGNRYLAENIFNKVLRHLEGIQLTIISEWEPNPNFQDIKYVKWGLYTWRDEYKKADVILCPQNPLQPAKSHIKVITAFAMKKPVICSIHPAYKEIVEHGVNGLFYKTEEELIYDVNLFRNTLLIKEMGEAGYKRIVKQFDVSTIVDAMSQQIFSDLKMPNIGRWLPTAVRSGLRWSKTNIKVDVIYAPLLQWQSYGDFVFDAFQKTCGVDSVKQFNELEDMIEYRNKHGWTQKLCVFIEFNPRWYDIPKEIQSRSIMYGWDTHSHFFFSHFHNLQYIFKRMYISGKNDVGRMCANGACNIRWIPEAHCNEIHNIKWASKREKRLVFVGQIDAVIRDKGGMTRLDYVNKLSEIYKDRFMVCRNFYGKEYAKIVSNSYLNLDLPIAHNIGTRPFESQAMGTMCIRADNKASGFGDYFRDGENIMLFEPGDIRGLCHKVDMYFEDREVETVIQDRLLDCSMYQSYENRIKYILEDLGL